MNRAFPLPFNIFISSQNFTWIGAMHDAIVIYTDTTDATDHFDSL